MAARLVAIVLAFIVTGAPVVTTACQAECAGRATGSAGAGMAPRHSCHAAPVPDGKGWTDVAHNCGHADGDDQINGDQTARIYPPSTVALAFMTSPAPVADVRRAVYGFVDHSPPGAFSRNTQLRV